MPTTKQHADSGEGLLDQLTDDEYFESLKTCPAIFDAEGNTIEGIFNDVLDLRADRRSGGGS